MQTVSERVTAYREAKKTFKTNKAVAEHYQVSAATVSRYLSIKDNDLLEVESGIKPIRNDRKRTVKSTIPSEVEVNIMRYAAHTQYFIAVQAAQSLSMSLSALRNVLEIMVAKSLLNKSTEYLPHVFSLTARGRVFVSAQTPRHFYSSSAIHQRLMRNAVELEIQKKNSSAIFKSRIDCWERGLFPAVGEHLLGYKSGGKQELALVIIDDYGLSPIRLRSALIRLHDVEKKRAKGNVVLTWADAVDRYFVYSTTELQKKNYERYYLKKSEEFLIQPVFRYISPIWK